MGGGVVNAISDTLTGDASNVFSGAVPDPAMAGSGMPDLSARLKQTASTPDGMELSNAFGGDVEFLEIPGVVTDLRQPDQPAASEESQESADTLPAYSTADPDMDFYRLYASDLYQLVN